MNLIQRLERIEKILLPLEPLVKKLTPEITSSIISIAKIKNLNEIIEAALLVNDHKEKLHIFQKNIGKLQQINSLLTKETVGKLLDLNSYKNQLLNTAMTDLEIQGIMTIKNNLSELLLLATKVNRIDDLDNLISELEKTKKLLSSTVFSAREAKMLLSAAKERLSDAQSIMFKTKNQQYKINKELNSISAEVKKIKSLNINVDFIEYEGNKSSYVFDRKTNTLNIKLREGKQGVPGNYKGDKGDSGENGTDFKIDFFGYKKDMVRYGRFLQGTSFLSLDEIPVRIYFKKTDAMNDWTKGQPFGIGCREYKEEQGFVNIIDGLNIDLLAKEIEKRLKKEK